MDPSGPPLPSGATPLTEPHPDDCFGCGAEGIAGVHMAVHQVGGEVIGDVVFGPRHTAGHGAVHGGVVATVADDLLSYLLFVHTEPAVTRSLQVGYLKPVLAGVPYRLTARLTGEEGRKLFMACAGETAEGVTAFTADAVFVRVDPTYFDRPGARVPARLLERRTAPADGAPPP